MIDPAKVKKVLDEWLAFSDDVQASDKAGQDHLDYLRGQTAALCTGIEATLTQDVLKLKPETIER